VDHIEEIELSDVDDYEIPESDWPEAAACGIVIMGMAYGHHVVALRKEEAVEVLRELRRMQNRSVRCGPGHCFQLALCPHRPGWTRVGVGVGLAGS
jgi:hypothetical protein